MTMPDIPGWEHKTPEQKRALLQEVVGLGGLNEESDLVKEQIHMAQALRRPSGRQYYGAAAGALGGIGDALQSISGVVQENRARDALVPLRAKIGAGRMNVGEAMLESGAYVDGPPGPVVKAMDDRPPYHRWPRPEENTQPGRLPYKFW